MPTVNIRRMLLRPLLDAALKNSPKAVLELVRYYNGLVLKGDIARARAQIKVEFMRNRQVATMFYKKYEQQMSDEVKAIFLEMMEDTNGHDKR